MNPPPEKFGLPYTQCCKTPAARGIDPETSGFKGVRPWRAADSVWATSSQPANTVLANPRGRRMGSQLKLKLRHPSNCGLSRGGHLAKKKKRRMDSLKMALRMRASVPEGWDMRGPAVHPHVTAVQQMRRGAGCLAVALPAPIAIAVTTSSTAAMHVLGPTVWSCTAAACTQCRTAVRTRGSEQTASCKAAGEEHR